MCFETYNMVGIESRVYFQLFRDTSDCERDRAMLCTIDLCCSPQTILHERYQLPPRWCTIELEGVQLFGLVDSPVSDSRVPVDSRVQQNSTPAIWRMETNVESHGSLYKDPDSRVFSGPASLWTRESQLTALVHNTILSVRLM